MQPTGYNVSAENGKYILDLTVTVQKSVPMMVDYPLRCPVVWTFQQYSLLQGTLKSKSGEEYSFRQPGFSGYATGGCIPSLADWEQRILKTPMSHSPQPMRGQIR